MKRILFMCLCLSLAVLRLGAVTGTGVVRGKLIGQSSHLPVEYATIALYDCVQQKNVSGTMTDSLGNFRITDVAAGQYTVRCTYVGYGHVESQKILLDGKRHSVNLDTLWMDDSGEQLSDVTVTTHRSTYVQTIDKKVFNIGADIASGSGSVSDLMQNIPSVQVDVEGNVALRGDENVMILIDGKPSVMTAGANRSTVLQQMPAGMIERVEVITNPSAQFKPDGTSGIINIITKKDRQAGMTGSLTANVGNRGRYNGGLSLGYASQRFGINGNYGYRSDRRDRWQTDDRTIIGSTEAESSHVVQDRYSKAPSRLHIMGLGLQWKPSERDVIEMSGNHSQMKFPRTEDNRLTQSRGGEIMKRYDRRRMDHERQKEGDAALSYTHQWGGGTSLLIDYSYAIEDGVEHNQYTNLYQIPTAYTTQESTRIQQKNVQHLVRALFESQLDENRKVVVGYETQLDRSDMSYLAQDFSAGVWSKNQTKSNDFRFHDYVHSLYVTFEQTQGRFGYLAGLRSEESLIRSQLLTLDQTVRDDYFLIYPSLHTSYKLTERQELQLNYSLRVHRPEGDDLNPFPEYQDPYNMKRGNPHLKPEKIHSFELGWQWRREPLTLVVTPYYRYTFDKMTRITQAAADGVVLTTKENMASSKAAGTELILNAAVGRWLSYNVSSNLYYNTIDASDLGFNRRRQAWAWYVSGNANWIVTSRLMLQLNSRYNSSVLTPQGSKEATFIANVGAKYDIPKWNLSLTATVSDLFDTYRQVIKVDTPGLVERNERSRSPRTIYVGGVYRFGSKGHKPQHKESELKYDESL